MSQCSLLYLQKKKKNLKENRNLSTVAAVLTWFVTMLTVKKEIGIGTHKAEEKLPPCYPQCVKTFRPNPLSVVVDVH